MLARLSPPKIWLGRNGEQRRTPGIGRAVAVMPRALLTYRLFDLSDIPANERDAALAQRLEQATPFERHGTWLVRRSSHTMAWLWDRDDEPGWAGGRVIPEPLLQAPGSGDAVRLLAQREGYEGQCWDDNGVLTASRWWPEAPTTRDWQRFERAAGRQASSEAPAPQSPEWLARPWASNHSLTSGASSRGLRWAALLLAMGLTVELTAGGVEAWRWQQRQAELAERIDSLETRAETVLSARRRAREARSQAQTLQQQLRAVRQLPLMADVLEVVEDRSSRNIAAWNYSQGSLQLHVTGVGDAGSVVSRLEDLPRLRSVGVESTRDRQLRLRMEVMPHGS